MTNAIRIHHHGGPEVLSWEPVSVPDPGSGEVRLRHTAVGLNFIDVYFRTGLYPPATLPFTPGFEGAGVVEAIGPDVTTVSVGDRVGYCSGPPGAYAQVRVLPADKLIPLPDGIDDEQAAAMLLQGLTARYLLRQTRVVKPGDTILIHAAAGGVGLLMCQWAAALGATVIGTVGSADKAALAKAHGCHHPILYKDEDFVERVHSLTSGAGVPVVYDSVGKDTFLKSLGCLEPRGVMVSFGQSSGAVDPINIGILSQKGSLYLTRPTLFHYVATRDALLDSAQDLFEQVLQGSVRIVIQRRFALSDAADAHAALEGRQTAGSTVLIP